MTILHSPSKLRLQPPCIWFLSCPQTHVHSISTHSLCSRQMCLGLRSLAPAAALTSLLHHHSFLPPLLCSPVCAHSRGPSCWSGQVPALLSQSPPVVPIFSERSQGVSVGCPDPAQPAPSLPPLLYHAPFHMASSLPLWVARHPLTLAMTLLCTGMPVAHPSSTPALFSP